MVVINYAVKGGDLWGAIENVKQFENSLYGVLTSFFLFFLNLFELPCLFNILTFLKCITFLTIIVELKEIHVPILNCLARETIMWQYAKSGIGFWDLSWRGCLIRHNTAGIIASGDDKIFLKRCRMILYFVLFSFFAFWTPMLEKGSNPGLRSIMCVMS